MWTAGGSLLDSAVFSSVTANGWQEVLFRAPIAIKADTTYIASYHSNKGNYAATAGGLLNAVTRGSLTALGSNASSGNGLYSYSATRKFPSNFYNATNYWVDVIFALDTSSTYTFKLTSVTDNAGNTRNTGTLQTLSVTLAACSEAHRPVIGTTPATGVNITTETAPFSSLSDTKSLAGKNEYMLGQNYPNPFNKETIIQYQVPVASYVSLSLFDMNGRLVKVLVNGSMEQGTHTVRFNPGSLSNGIYFYKIQAGNFTAVKKMIIQR